MTRLADMREVGTAAALVAAAALVSREAQAQSGRLLVFLHVAVKQRALQSGLQAALPGVAVTAVGRIGDFERSLKEGTDAVVALPVVLSAFKLSPKLRGARGGSSEEKYSLVGVGNAPNPQDINALGALDFLGREGTNGFVKSLLEASPRIERVSKVEDLLPLLQMQRVDAILLPSRLYSEIKGASKLNLAQRELGKSVGLPAAVGITASGAQVLNALSQMSTQAAKILGVDSWR